VNWRIIGTRLVVSNPVLDLWSLRRGISLGLVPTVLTEIIYETPALVFKGHYLRCWLNSDLPGLDARQHRGCWLCLRTEAGNDP
jgi:hypothetical protein